MNFLDIKKIKVNKSNGCFFKIAWFVFIFLISVLLSRFVMSGVNDMLAVGRESEIVQVDFEKDVSLDEAADILVEKNVISEKWFFKMYAFATKSPKTFESGMYELETSMDYQAIINRLKDKSSAKEAVEVTLTEGMNILECANIMEKYEICSKDEFLKYCNSNAFDDKFSFIKDISNSSKRIYKLEGYIFPDTYKFYKNEKTVNVINKLLNNFQKRINEKKEVNGYSSKVSILELSEDQNMKLDDLVNISSLIQAEAADKEDMHKVSSVINNRLETLKTGGKNKFGEFSMNVLRIDATRYYPYKNEASIPSGLKKNFVGKFNTYKIEGLTPGPICNPGLDAFYAALFPAQTDYYYYCHSSTGQSFFAKTNEAHLINLKKAGIS